VSYCGSVSEIPDTRLDPLEDQRLVERCLAGDSAAWSALVRRHERLVYAVARSYRLSEHDMGDVFQEVFAALVGGLPRLRDPRALVRWLSSTAQRIARATAFKRRREQALAPGDPEGLTAIAEDAPPIGADLERLEEQAVVRLGLAALPPRCQRLIQALYYEDPAPAYADVARRLGIPMGSIGPTRARCFERLRAAIRALEVEEASIIPPSSPTFERGTGGPEGHRGISLGEGGLAPAREDRA
jgi:RNA polymerase sigma factor (sigma-70 family)